MFHKSALSSGVQALQSTADVSPESLIVARPYLVSRLDDKAKSLVLILPAKRFVAISARYEQALKLIAAQPMTVDQLIARYPWIDTTVLIKCGLVEVVPPFSRPPKREVVEVWARIVWCRVRGRHFALNRTIQLSLTELSFDSVHDALVVLRLRAAAETARLLPFSSKRCTYVAVALAGALRRRRISCQTRVLTSSDGAEFHADVVSGAIVCDPAEHCFAGRVFRADAIAPGDAVTGRL